MGLTCPDKIQIHKVLGITPRRVVWNGKSPSKLIGGPMALSDR